MRIVSFRYALLQFFLMSLVTTHSIAQDKKIVMLNSHFYPTEENDSLNYVYKAIYSQIDDSTSIQRIFTLQNQMIKIVRVSYNSEGNFFEEASENYDIQGKLTSKKTKNIDNGKYHIAYYDNDTYLGEVIFEGDGQFETRKTGKDEVMTSMQNEFEPTPFPDKDLWQKNLIKNLHYPSKGRGSRETQTVMLVIYVNKNGEKTGIEVANPASVEKPFAYEALRAANKYEGKYTPAKDKEGNAIDGKLYVPIRFKFD